MTTFTNNIIKDYPKALRFDESFLGEGGHYGRVTFHCGDDEVQCFKLALVLASKFWRDLLEFTGNENVHIIVCEYSEKLIWNYKTLCERGEVNYNKQLKDEDFETFVEKTRPEMNISDTFNVADKSTCPKCLKRFSNPRTCRKHIKTFHAENNKKKYNCELCPKKFKTKNGLKSHTVNDHENTEPFQCLDCNQVYQNRNELKRHCLLEKHTCPKFNKTNDKSSRSLLTQECKECHKIVDGGNMEKHMKKYHSDESRTWTCSECGESFKRKDSLLRHERLKHYLYNRQLTAVDKLYDIDNKTYQCPACKTTFADKEDAKDHILQSQCNLKCDICGKQFRLAQHLKRHKKIHDNKNTPS